MRGCFDLHPQKKQRKALQAEATLVTDTKELLDPAEIRALFQRRTASEATAVAEDHPEPATEQFLLETPELPSAVDLSPLVVPRPYRFDDFSAAPSPPQDSPKLDAALPVRIELGRTTITPQETENLPNGTVIPLDALAGDPVDILVDGRLVARGEVLVLEDKFCVRISEILRSAPF